MQVQLSAVIITFNEEKNIERCVLSAQKVADEVLVVDSFSKDKTKLICEKLGVRFLEHAFEGHIQQKNWAKSQAQFDYVLSLDADEALDEKLTKDILSVKHNWKSIAYKMNRMTNYCGYWVRHTSWYPDTKIRLFDRRVGRWDGLNPHDEYRVPSKEYVPHLEGDILHYSFYTKAEHLLQIEKFSTIGAQALLEKGKRSNLVLIVVKPLARFIKNYVVRLGFLDGKAGWDISTLSAYANYLKYKKLSRLQKQGN
ncbi:MAG: glycosyltransferase involved in cell wall biosynthesis [Vicingaceae bacterium]|jgi:glycosyltransferase involved in cell wall biosynthesis